MELLGEIVEQLQKRVAFGVVVGLETFVPQLPRTAVGISRASQPVIIGRGLLLAHPVVPSHVTPMRAARLPRVALQYDPPEARSGFFRTWLSLASGCRCSQEPVRTLIWPRIGPFCLGDCCSTALATVGGSASFVLRCDLSPSANSQEAPLHVLGASLI